MEIGTVVGFGRTRFIRATTGAPQGIWKVLTRNMPETKNNKKQGKLGPFVLRPILQQRIWGVTTLPAWLEQPAPGKPIGEAWLTAEECVAEGRSLANGSTLAELADRYAEELGNASGHGFPLLMKLLFPREKLSVQVHPNDAQAQALGMPRGKSECWYVLEAEPGAEVAVGLREPIAMDEVARAIEEGTLESRLRYVPVKAGDMVYVDAGTIHAIGPGMTVLETQQYSDTTYRLYDYGRPRELHVHEGLAVSRAETQAGLTAPLVRQEFTQLAVSPYFVVDRFRPDADKGAPLGKEGELQILVALGEGCSVRGSDNPEESLALRPGHACVLPAENVAYRIASSKGAEVIRVAEK